MMLMDVFLNRIQYKRSNPKQRNFQITVFFSSLAYKEDLSQSLLGISIFMLINLVCLCITYVFHMCIMSLK